MKNVYEIFLHRTNFSNSHVIEVVQKYFLFENSFPLEGLDMTLTEWISFNITTKGPFDLKRTLETGHSSFPIPQTDKLGRYYMVVTVPYTNKKVVSRFYQKGSTRTNIDISYFNQSLSENNIKDLKLLFRKILGLNLNLLEFYEEFNNDPIRSCFDHCKGIRLTCAHDYFESLISSILTQNSTVWKWIGQARKIKELMGEKFPTEHFMIYSFPEPKQLFRNKHLLKQAKLGYREEYVIDSTEDIANYQIRLEKLLDYPTLDAKKELLKLKGIGSKVADMFLLYGLGKYDAPPVDIWIQRGVSKIFFRGREKTLEECRDKLVEHYGKWAGLAQLYIFDWMRTKMKK
ncbi:MAG: DNA-3-methyladenine glycosylase 2 family protein [Asgard group archaeon]|nr:DNA-3-methyladenine glycosylase 2 family protein [Asgard group archaeon]